MAAEVKAPQVAPLITEFNSSFITSGNVDSREVEYTDEKTGKPSKTTITKAKVGMDKPVVFTIPKIRVLKLNVKNNKCNIGFSLTPEQSLQFKNNVDQAVIEHAWREKEKFFPHLNNSEILTEVKMLPLVYKSAVKKGAANKEKPGFFYPDALNADMAMKKVNGQLREDENYVIIESTADKKSFQPYSWTAIEKKFADVSFQITDIDFRNKNFSPKLCVRYIGLEAEPIPAPVVSKRRLEMEVPGAPGTEGSKGATASVAPTSESASSTGTPVATQGSSKRQKN